MDALWQSRLASIVATDQLLIVRGQTRYCGYVQGIVDLVGAGAQGDKGDKGDPGAKGDPGDPGNVNAAWPVGSVFISVLSTNPATLLGFGTWAAIGAGRVLIGLNASDTDFDSLEETGGSKTVASVGTVSTPTFTGSSANTSLVSAGTPAGTVSQPTFTGSALAAHAHELPFQIPTTTTTRQIAAAAFGTGTSRAATAVSTTGTANTTSAAVALSESKSAGTPAGTVSQPTFTGSALGTHQHAVTATGTVSQPTYTGTATSVVPPYLVVNMWKRTA